MNRNRKWNRVLGFGVAVIMVAAAGCAGRQTAPTTSIPQPDSNENMIWSSESNRPGWTLEEPATANGVMTFIGLSGNFATEQLARDDARRNSINSVVSYMGTVVKNKFEKATMSYGLASNVVDPTTSARTFEKQLAVNVAKQVKVQKWYIEKWQKPAGTAFIAFALSTVPEATVEDTFKDTAKDMAKKAEEDARKAADDTAKHQAEKAAEFWKQMQEQGLTE